MKNFLQLRLSEFSTIRKAICGLEQKMDCAVSMDTSIKVFRSSALTPANPTNNEIQCIAEDNQHKISVGTLEGIEIIDKKNFSISHFKHELIDHERIDSILVDTEGFIWIGTSSYGVIRIHPESGETRAL